MIDEDADASATPRNSTPNGVSEIIEKVRDDQDWKDVVFLMWNEQKIADPADINEPPRSPARRDAVSDVFCRSSSPGW